MLGQGSKWIGSGALRNPRIESFSKDESFDLVLGMKLLNGDALGKGYGEYLLTCGEPIIRLHMALKSNDQLSMGPRAVDAQSILRVNWICLGRAWVSGSRVQSNDDPSAYPVLTVSSCLGGFKTLSTPVVGLDISRCVSLASELVEFVVLPK
jgi:hypothetical protein